MKASNMKKLAEKITVKLQELRTKYPDIPVPVVAIAKDLGMKIFTTYDFTSTQSGSIKKEDGDYIIYINASENSERQRFTIAHEIGHFLMHDAYLNKVHESVTDIKQPVGLNRLSSGTTKEGIEKNREIEANLFAAELLMPDDIFKKIFETSNTIDDVAKAFNVSSSAATIRAKDLLGLFIM